MYRTRVKNTGVTHTPTPRYAGISGSLANCIVEIYLKKLVRAKWSARGKGSRTSKKAQKHRQIQDVKLSNIFGEARFGSKTLAHKLETNPPWTTTKAAQLCAPHPQGWDSTMRHPSSHAQHYIYITHSPHPGRAERFSPLPQQKALRCSSSSPTTPLAPPWPSPPPWTPWHRGAGPQLRVPA